MLVAWIAIMTSVLTFVLAGTPFTDESTTVRLGGPALVADQQLSACSKPPLGAPGKLQFVRLANASISGEPQHDVTITYDFGDLPVYVDGVGELPSAGELRFATPDSSITFRCGDENGATLASVDLNAEFAALRLRAASSSGSYAAMLSSARAAYAINDVQSTTKKLEKLTSTPGPPDQTAEAYLLLAAVKESAGDTASANNALFTAKRLASSNTALAGVSARADLASYMLKVKGGHLADAAHVVSGIDASKISDSATAQRVHAAKNVAILLTSDPSNETATLARVLGDDLNDDTESAAPGFERASRAIWYRSRKEFIPRIQGILQSVFFGADFETKPCPSSNPSSICAILRARQLKHYDAAGNESSFDGWLARIKFRVVRWDVETVDGDTTVYVQVQYAVSERLAGNVSGRWEPTSTASHGIESKIESDAQAAAAILTKQISSIQSAAAP